MKNPLKNAVKLSGIGVQMGLIIYLFVRLGNWLDQNYSSNQNIFLMLCTLIGVALSIYIVLKQLNKIKH
ncbi:AtpZ/AtpI family protein [Flavobacteriaceae bacterium]|nr:AtpZ/AtpI family protein [Flavobacteriaceae bacterium]